MANFLWTFVVFLVKRQDAPLGVVIVALGC